MAAVAASPRGCDDEEEPLEIEDYSCANTFEEVCALMERFLRDEFCHRAELQRFIFQGDSTTKTARQGASLSSPPAAASNAQRPLDSQTSTTVIAKTFSLYGSKATTRKGNSSSSSQKRGVDDVVVEIHVDDVDHPISSLFSLPLFLLVKCAGVVTTYRRRDSSYYLSLLTNAAANVFSETLGFCLDAKSHTKGAQEVDRTALQDMATLRARGLYYSPQTIACFVPVGDKFHHVFIGNAPPLSLPVRGEDTLNNSYCTRPGRSAHRNADDLASSIVTVTRFQTTTYATKPAACQTLSEFLDAFHLQIGHQSRVSHSPFDGVCICVDRTYVLPVSHRESGVDAIVLNRLGMSWDEIVSSENEQALPLCGTATHPFGTITNPIQGIEARFIWTALTDVEAQENSNNQSTIDPFRMATVTRKNCRIFALTRWKNELEMSHTAAKRLSELAFLVTDYIAQQNRLEGKSSAAISSSEASSRQRGMDFQALLLLAKDIVNGGNQSTSPDKQQQLIRSFDKAIASSISGSKDAVQRTDLRDLYFPDSLLCRFAYVAVTRLDSADDMIGLWKLVVEQIFTIVSESTSSKGEMPAPLRRLISSFGLPSLGRNSDSDAQPVDHSLPLVVQKLQLLQYCLEMQYGAVSQKSRPRGKTSDASDSERSSGGTAPTSEKSMRLIATGEPIIIPSETVSLPCTSDDLFSMVHSPQDPRAAAGATFENNDLLYDMCVFLHANGAATGKPIRFPDFVQWHSPRDFVPPPAGVNPATLTDDDYLSQRMKRNQSALASGDEASSPSTAASPASPESDCPRPHHTSPTGAVWWALWEKATPRSAREIEAEVFNPASTAKRALNWLSAALSPTEALVEVLHANFSCAIHRIMSHRCVLANAPLAAFISVQHDAILAGIQSASMMAGSGSAQWGGVLLLNDLQSTYITLSREVASMECALCVALAIDHLLVPTSAQSSPPSSSKEAKQPKENTASEAVTCRTLSELTTVLTTPRDTASEGRRTAAIDWTVWEKYFLPIFTMASKRRYNQPPPTAPVGKDPALSVITQASSIEPECSTVQLTCNAERPVNVAPTFQHWCGQTLKNGSFRIALALSEGVV